MLFNEYVKCITIDDAWKYWYNLIKTNVDDNVAESRDGNVVGEIINATTVINIRPNAKYFIYSSKICVSNL